MDESLSTVEACIQQYHGSRLAVWTAQQREVLRRAGDLDSDALEGQRTISDSCFDGLSADLSEHRAARRDATAKSAVALRGCEQDFMAELRMLSDGQSAQMQELATGFGETVSANGDAWLEGQWDVFDGQLRTILWKHARLLSGTSIAEGMAEIYHEGNLQPHLDTEKRGWAESQEQDLQLLQTEIDKEHTEIFAAQSAKLRALAPTAVFGKDRSAQLAEIAAEERRRLMEIEVEVRSAYEAEIAACLMQQEEDYRGYDLELQSILIRTMRKRVADAAHMRRLKLALCRWRLDYQRVFHDHCNALSEPDSTLLRPPTSMPEGARQEDTARQLESVRQLVVDLWARNQTPNFEIRRFLDKVESAAAHAGRAGALARVYQEELSQYGALPILDRADRPELLDCWLETLREGGMPAGASKRPSISSSLGKDTF